MRKIYLVWIVFIALVVGNGYLLLTPTALNWQDYPNEASIRLPQLQADAAPEKVAIESLKSAWETPLFSPSREPDRQGIQTGNQAGQDPAALQLVGVLMSDEHHGVALIKPQSKAVMHVRIGEQLPSGWQLTDLATDSATLSRNHQTIQLRLRQGPRIHIQGAPKRSHLPKESITIKDE